MLVLKACIKNASNGVVLSAVLAELGSPAGETWGKMNYFKIL